MSADLMLRKSFVLLLTILISCRRVLIKLYYMHTKFTGTLVDRSGLYTKRTRTLFCPRMWEHCTYIVCLFGGGGRWQLVTLYPHRRQRVVLYSISVTTRVVMGFLPLWCIFYIYMRINILPRPKQKLAESANGIVWPGRIYVYIII